MKHYIAVRARTDNEYADPYAVMAILCFSEPDVTRMEQRQQAVVDAGQFKAEYFTGVEVTFLAESDDESSWEYRLSSDLHELDDAFILLPESVEEDADRLCKSDLVVSSDGLTEVYYAMDARLEVPQVVFSADNYGNILETYAIELRLLRDAIAGRKEAA